MENALRDEPAPAEFGVHNNAAVRIISIPVFLYFFHTMIVPDCGYWYIWTRGDFFGFQEGEGCVCVCMGS